MTPAEIAAAVERANQRLDAKAGFDLVCPRCQHQDAVPNDPRKSRYTCDQCGCKIAFGEEQPDIKVLPHADRRFIVSQFAMGNGDKIKTVNVTLDREYATQYAFEILSVCAPGKWRSLCAQVQRGHDVPGAPQHEGEDVAAILDAPTPQPNVCACGAPSVHANGACASCLERALGGQ